MKKIVMVLSAAVLVMFSMMDVALAAANKVRPMRTSIHLPDVNDSRVATVKTDWMPYMCSGQPARQWTVQYCFTVQIPGLTKWNLDQVSLVGMSVYGFGLEVLSENLSFNPILNVAYIRYAEQNCWEETSINTNEWTCRLTGTTACSEVRYELMRDVFLEFNP